MKLAKIALIALLTASAAYCQAGDETRLDLVYKRSEPADKNAPLDQPAQAQKQDLGGTCTVVIASPVDVRKNKDTLGTTFRDNPIVSDRSPAQWLESALMDLNGHGLNTVSGNMPGNASASRVATLSTDLDKLYVWYHSMNLNATLVVRARMRNSRGEALEKSYRVNGTKLNWWNGDAELVETMNLAAGRLLEQIASDIDGLCGGKAGS